jgi:hypothetical protein
MRLSVIPLALVAILGLSVNGPASEKQIEVRWSELGAFLEYGGSLGRGSAAMLVLPNGAIVQGQIVGVEKNELILKVSKSSDKQAYPKGRLSIPRSSVTTIRLTQTKGARGRTIGTLAGIFGGAAIGTVVAFMQPDNTSPSGGARAGVAALLVGPAIGGYYVGRSFDRKTTLIKVLPD